MIAGDGGAATYQELMRLSVGAAALASLAEAGVFDAVSVAPRSGAELAATLGLHEPALVRALRVAEGLGVVARIDDRWSIAPQPLAVAEHGPLRVSQLVAMLRLLPEHLRTGVTQSHHRDELTEAYRHATPGLSRLFEPWADRLADRLDRPLGSILDVGAGAGIWSLQMARRRPGCTVTALDRGPVLDGFVANARRLEVAHATVDGDYHHVEIDGGYDRVVLANVLHLETPTAAQRLLERAAGWLRAGGDLVVADVMVRTDRTALDVSIYELHLALRVPGARVYSAETIERWCVEAGLVRCALHTLGDVSGGAALVAEKRA